MPHGLLVSPELTLYQALFKVIAAYPRRAAVAFGDTHLTFAELGQQVDEMALKLRAAGVGPGDRVATLLPNSLELLYAFFALPALGAVIVPLNPVYRKKEIQHILEDSEATFVIAEPKPLGNDVRKILNEVRATLPHLRAVILRAAAEEGQQSLARLEPEPGPLRPAPVSPGDLCALVYTSGTTGLPKAVMHSHASMIGSISQNEGAMKQLFVQKLFGVLGLIRKYGPRFVIRGLRPLSVLVSAPMHTLNGYGSVLYALLFGYRAVILDRFNPYQVLAAIEKEHIGALPLTPSMLAALLDCEDLPRRDHSSLLAIGLGAAPCPPELVRRARRAFGCPVLISFGATEVGGATFLTSIFDPEDLQTETVGKLAQGMSARIVDDRRSELPRGRVGELALRLPSTMLGYYKAPELTAQALDAEGWYYTGDLATMDDRGYVRIVGRKKDMIIRGGQNIFPAEIENHLMGKPGIQQVAVLGVPESLAGERVWAFVVPKHGTSLTPSDVIAYCRGELAPYKIPDQVRIVDSLPMTSTGKPIKAELRELALRELSGRLALPQPVSSVGTGSSR